MVRQILVLLFGLASALVFIYPAPEGIPFDLLRAGVLIALLWTLYRYAFPAEKGLPTGAYPRRGKALLRSRDEESERGLRDRYDQLLDRVLNTIYSLNPAYKAAIYMLDPGTGGYTLQKASNNQFVDQVSRENALIKKVVGQTEVTLLQAKEARGAWEALLTERVWRGSECLLGIRLIYKGAAVGALILYTDHFSNLQDRDRGILANLGSMISLGMDEIEKIEQLTTDSSYYHRVNELLERLEISSEEPVLYESVRELCRSFFTYDKLSISLVGPEDGRAVVKLVDGIREDIDAGSEFSLDHTLHGIPILKGETVHTPYWTEAFPDMNRFQPGDRDQYNFMSVLAVPIKSHQEVVGSIALELFRTRPYTEAEKKMLSVLAFTVGSILSWQEEYRLMHRHAIHDGLTNLLNHKAFMNRFQEEISRSLRFSQSMVLVVLDLDKFKRINDTYGHLFGDYVIKTVAQLIKADVRAIDVVGRYGGEEYAVLLINTSKTPSLPVAERIVKSIEEYHFSSDNIDVRMTISAGMAEFPTDTDQGKDLIVKADMSMYKTKEKGGNGVTLYGDHE